MAADCDVIVVGLGAAGGVIAAELASAGAKVIALEKGAFYKPDDFTGKFDEIRIYCRSAIVPKMATDPLTWRPNESTRAQILPWASNRLGLGNPFQIPPSIGTGGGTIHWGGASFRFREADFRMRKVIEERFGRNALPEGHALVDWPVGYDELEPYYDRTEWELGVAGAAGNVKGEIVAGGNPFEAPRQRGYPMPPLARHPVDKDFTGACRRLGLSPFPTPAAIATIPFKGRPACTNCGFCHGYPCHIGAKVTTHELVEAAVHHTGNLEVRPHARVFRIDRGRDGHARGVTYFTSSGRTVELSASVVVLAAYSFENARLLLASGINGNGQVGRNLTIHNYGWFTGLMPTDTNPFVGSLQCGSVIDDYTSELVPDNDDGVLWGSPINTWTGDMQPIEVIHGLPPHVPKWGDGFKDWIRRNYRRLFRMYSQHSTIPSPAAYCDLDPTVTDSFGQPALRITHDWSDYDRRSAEYFFRIKRQIAQEMGMVEWWEDSPTPNYHVTVHDAGLHRMGEDAATSVTSINGEVHECRGLYACGGGQFPTLPAYNPTETIFALAYLTAEHLKSAEGRF
jgi:gluconate 2-dehydrogenase alpha chain